MKKKRIRKLQSWITAVLITALLAVTLLKVNTFAADGSPTVYEVESAEQFIEAVEQAQDGDVIKVMRWIYLKGIFHFTDDKHLTIIRDNSGAFLGINDLNPGIGETIIKNMTFDGQGIAAGDPFVSITNGYYTFEGCTFQNCGQADNAGGQNAMGAAMMNYSATVTLKGCTFKDNYAYSGGHIYAYDNAVTTLDGCALMNGHAYDQGGGVYNIGRMTVKNTLIFGNTAANGGNDIRNLRTVDLKDSIETLNALVNDPQKVVEGWKDEGTGTFFAVPSECSMEYLTLVVSDKPQDDPGEDPADDPGDNPGEGGGDDDPADDKPSEPADDVSGNDPGDQSGDSGSGGSTGGGNTYTETNTTTTTTSDNSTTTSTTTTDNSDRSTVTDRHDTVSNSTVNNYYQGAAAGEAKAELTGAASVTSSAAQAPQSVRGQSEADTSPSGMTKSAYNGQDKAENTAAVNSLDHGTDTPEAPHFDIDLTGVDCAIRTNDAGSYDIVIRNAPRSETQDVITLTAYQEEAPDREPEQSAAPDDQPVTEARTVSPLDVVQTALLAAVLICLIWDFGTRRRINPHAEQ